MAERFRLADFAYAHRGLWSASGPPENSFRAFKAAADQGLGVELDLRPSADGAPMIFHDPVLDRMTDRSGVFESYSAKTLIGISLNGGGTIPRFEDLLREWPAKTPLLCELKIDGRTDPVSFAETVANLLSTVTVPAAMMSFSTEAVAATPETIMRGQLILPSAQSGADDLAGTPTVSVDYLACHTSDAGDPGLQAARKNHPLVCWTVTEIDKCAALAPLTDSQIFEGFDPALAKSHILNT
ncbi:MAG: glycerophosphodiester phosphodiesterase family protein [Pseudomonadota bacterium]